MWRKALAQPLQPDARRRGSTVGAREEKERGLAAKLRRSQAQAGSEGLPRDDDTGGYEEDDVVEGEGE
jgi:hypothetical protein